MALLKNHLKSIVLIVTVLLYFNYNFYFKNLPTSRFF